MLSHLSSIPRILCPREIFQGRSYKFNDIYLGTFYPRGSQMLRTVRGYFQIRGTLAFLKIKIPLTRFLCIAESSLWSRIISRNSIIPEWKGHRVAWELTFSLGSCNEADGSKIKGIFCPIFCTDGTKKWIYHFQDDL